MWLSPARVTSTPESAFFGQGLGPGVGRGRIAGRADDHDRWSAGRRDRGRRPLRRDRPERTGEVVVGDQAREVRRRRLQSLGPGRVRRDIRGSGEIQTGVGRVGVVLVRIRTIRVATLVRVGDLEQERAVATLRELQRRREDRPGVAVVECGEDRVRRDERSDLRPSLSKRAGRGAASIEAISASKAATDFPFSWKAQRVFAAQSSRKAVSAFSKPSA